MRSQPNRLRPDGNAGHLYYVRVRSKFGPLYKIGFTKSESVAHRFTFKNNGDEQLLDAQFLFAYHEDAFNLEERLHAHFSAKKAFGNFASYEHLPLHKNGQSELYPFDILGIDPDYTEEQGAQTLASLAKIGMVASTPKTPLWVVVIGTALRWFFMAVWHILLLGERVLEILLRVDEKHRGELSGTKESKKQAAIQQGRDLANRQSMDALLEWVRQNQSHVALSIVASAAPSNPPNEEAAERGDPDEGEPDDEDEDPLEVADPMLLVRLVRERSGHDGSGFSCLASDLKATLLHIIDDPVLYCAATEALLIARAALFSGGHLDFSEFYEAIAPYEDGRAAVRRDLALLMESDVLIAELAKSYGLWFSDDAMLEFLTAAGNDKRFQSDDGAAMSDQMIIVEAERRAEATVIADNDDDSTLVSSDTMLPSDAGHESVERDVGNDIIVPLLNDAPTYEHLLSESENSASETMLWDGLFFDREDWLEQAFASGASPNALYNKTLPAIFVAAYLNRSLATAMLARYGAEYPSRPIFYFTNDCKTIDFDTLEFGEPAEWAIKHNNLEILRTLLSLPWKDDDVSDEEPINDAGCAYAAKLALQGHPEWLIEIVEARFFYVTDEQWKLAESFHSDRPTTTF